MELEQEQQIKPKVRRKGEIIKTRSEINNQISMKLRAGSFNPQPDLSKRKEKGTKKIKSQMREEI